MESVTVLSNGNVEFVIWYVCSKNHHGRLYWKPERNLSFLRPWQNLALASLLPNCLAAFLYILSDDKENISWFGRKYRQSTK